MRAPLLRAAAAAGLFGAAACSDPLVPERTPNYTGRIEAVEFPTAAVPDGPTIVWVLPEGDPCGIRFTLTPQTALLDGDEPAAVGDLRTGRTADVWFDGVVLESCPAQGTADVLRMR